MDLSPTEWLVLFLWPFVVVGVVILLFRVGAFDPDPEPERPAS